MMKNELKKEPSYSLSAKMENYAPADSLLKLGRKLVEELGLEDSTDTLGRWMAHYIADLISKVEHASGDEKSSIERECFAAILSLWKHRSEFPDGKRPFEEFEPVFRAIESLDPENATPRYYRMARPPKGEMTDTPEQESFLKLIDGLDYSAKVLIGYFLAEAAGTAIEKSKEWVKLAEEINERGSPEVIIRFISTVADENKEIDPNEVTISLLNDRINRLRGFIGMAESRANALEELLHTHPDKH